MAVLYLDGVWGGLGETGKGVGHSLLKPLLHCLPHPHMPLLGPFTACLKTTDLCELHHRFV